MGGLSTETDYQVKPVGLEVRICCLCWKQVRVEQWGSVGMGQASTWNGMKWYDVNCTSYTHAANTLEPEPEPESHVEVVQPRPID